MGNAMFPRGTHARIGQLRRCGWALLTALALVAPASASTFYVTPTGAGAHNGLTLGNAWSLAEANANASNAGADARLVLASGTYPDPIAPAASSLNGFRLSYIGPAAGDTSVVVNGITLKSPAVTVRWLKSSAGLTLDGTGNTATTYARSDSIVGCTIAGGVSVNGAKSCVLYGNRVRGEVNFQGNNGDRGYASCVYDGTLTRNTDSVTVRANRFDIGVTTVNNTDYRTFSFWGWTRHCVVDSNTVTWQANSANDSNNHSPVLYWLANTSNCEFKDNHTYVASTFDAAVTSLGAVVYAYYLRDSTSACTWTRDTIEAAPGGGVYAELGAGGSCSPLGMRDNSFSRCVFKLTGNIEWQASPTGFSMTGCVVATHDGTPFYQVGAALDSATIVHNTFYSLGGAMLWEGDAHSVPFTHSRIAGNVFLSGAGAVSCGTWSDPIRFHGGAVGSDSNVVYSYPGSSANAFRELDGGLCYNVAGWYAHTGNEQHSSWAAPTVFDTTWASLNLRPHTGSALVSAAYPSGYAGAFADSTGGAVSSTAPLITSLSVTYSHTGVGFVLNVRGHQLAGVTSAAVGATGQAVSVVDSTNVNVTVTAAAIASAGPYNVTVTSGSAVSNALVLTIADDTPPALPVLSASLGPTGVAYITFTAVGEDSLTGTATSYDLGYRDVGTLSAANWSNLNLYDVTYHYDLCPAPRPAGQADTITVYGLQPGRTYQFALDVFDAAGNDAMQQPAGFSNVVTLTMPVPASNETYPLLVSPGGAGQGTVPKWWPLLNMAGSAINYAACDSIARYPMVYLNPQIADSAGTWGKTVAIEAIQYLRKKNPSIKVLALPSGAQAFVSWLGGAEGFVTSADTLNRYNYYFQAIRAVRAVAGWPANDTGDLTPTGPYGYRLDTTSVSGFLWKRSRGAGYKNYFFDVARSTTTAGGLAGVSTLCNVNLAFKNGTAFPLVDSLVAVLTRHFAARKDWTGAWVWDGLAIDNFAQSMVSNFSADGDTADYTRAGYSTLLGFTNAWGAAVYKMARDLRRQAYLAGRGADFVICGNSGPSVAYHGYNGWARESWPQQVGGTWQSNFYRYPGGLLADQVFGFQPSGEILAAYPVIGDSIFSTTYTPSDYLNVRYGLGTACLTGARYAYCPAYSSYAVGGTPGTAMGNYSQWWYDEYGATPFGRSSVTAPTGWLGKPLSTYRQTDVKHGSLHANAPLANWVCKPVGASNSDTTWVGDFDQASDLTYWTLSSQTGKSSVARVTDTTYSAGGALRINVGTRTALDYQTGAAGPMGSITSSDTVSIEFWGRASGLLPITVSLRDSVTGNTVLNTTSGGKVWFEPTWKKYVLVGTCPTVSATGRVNPVFWAGDTTGTWWIDDVRCVKGRPRGGIYYRPFERGIVAVNPTGTLDSLTLTLPYSNLRGISGRASGANAGTRRGAGGTIPVPPGDAVFLIRTKTLEDK